jgi:hypothetical protein
MKTNRILFPRNARSFKGKRWANIALRTMHLIGIAGVGGGFLYQSPSEVWLPYLILSVASGFGIMCLDIWSNGIWFVQLRGIAILIKLILLLSVPFLKGYAGYALVIAIIISGVIAHAPGDVRYYSIFHGRRVEDLCSRDD